MKFTFNHTKKASYLGYVTQAIINNLAPLLYVTFLNQFNLTYVQIALFSTINFTIQMIVDLLATLFVDKIGWRISAVAAHLFAGVGLLGLGIFPRIFSNPYTGLMVAVVIYALGGGLIEVLISPIVEALPSDKKNSDMSLLHSFYCWGHVAVVLFSTLFFATIGIKNWTLLPILWSIIPFFNAFLFSKVPLGQLVESHEESIGIKQLFSKGFFWAIIVLMICSGAAEQAMSQWSSLFAELGVGVSKEVGDLLGPLVFAVLMGLSRVLYGIYGEKIKLELALSVSSLLCIISYLVVVFSPYPLLSVVACGITGFSVGLFWPGVTSIASKHFRRGGTAMFAILALSGDIGCAAGPGLVGTISSGVNSGKIAILSFWNSEVSKTTVGLKMGLLFSTIFAVVLFLIVTTLYYKNKKKKTV